MNEKNIEQQETLDETIELTYQEKIEGQLACLKEMNRILNGIVERHEANRNNS